MAELTLQSYVAAIEAQLSGGSADEATYHSRHILSQYPRYTPAFRLLGRALLLKGQVAEAEAAFRRVLSVEPSDVAAHLGLSEIYDHRRRGEEAIWHAERAMETEITNVTITDLLRVLYRRYRGEEQPRMSLTAVALTRQALQNHDYTQAIATLRDALERQPERTDLRLLLAEALWESGDHVAAAETARDVAEVLPDCFTANAILTRLWLEVGRPSDAQPYLSRLEALDPYAAVALASGQAVDAGAFNIEPLDYQRSAQSEGARGTPDWLKGIAQAESVPDAQAPEWTSRMLATAHHEDEPAEAPASEAATQVIPAASAPALQQEEPAAPETPALAAPLAAIAAAPALAASLDFEEEAAEAEDEDLFAGLESLFSETQDGAESFVAPFSTIEPALESPEPATETSPLPPLDSIQARPMPPAEDAMAWLRESGVELVDDEAPAFSLETGTEFPEAAPHDVADPMAWLSSYDSVLAEPGVPENVVVPSATMVFESGWEEGFIGQPEEPQEEAPQEVAALFEPEPAAPPLRGLTSRLGDPSIVAPVAAVAALTPEPAAEEPALEGWFAGFDEPVSAAQADSPAPEWLTDLGAVMTNEPNSAAGTPDEHEEILPHEPTEAAEAQPGWIGEPSEAVSDSGLGASAEIPEWLLESAPDAFAIPGAAGAEPAPVSDDLMPEWLMESAPEAVTDLTGETPAEVTPGSEEFDWLSTLNEPPAAEPTAAVDEAVIAAQADVPDWLDALEADVLATIDANQSVVAQPEAEATGDLLPFEEPEAWPVAEAEAVEVEPAEVAFAASVEPKAEPAEVTLSGETEPELTAEDWGAPEQVDLARIAPPTVMSADFIPAPEAEAPTGDWYTDAELVAEAPVAADGSLTEHATGDWLEDAALYATAEVESWPEIMQDEVDVEAWTAEPSFSAETQLGTDTLPWLAPLDSATEAEDAPSEAEGVGLAAVAGAAALGGLAFASIADEGDTAAVEAEAVDSEAVAEQADWLAADWPEDADSAALIEADELDALPDVEIAEETVIAPAANAPDWLNAMVPGLDLDYEVAGEPLDETVDADRDALDETLGAGSAYAWVIDLVDQEQAETETAPAEMAAAAAIDEPRFVFQQLPAWFRHAPSGEGEDDFADWPNDDSSLQAWQN